MTRHLDTGLEKSDFREFDTTYTTSGETIAIESGAAVRYKGKYGIKCTSQGTGDESAYAQFVPASDLNDVHIRAYVKFDSHTINGSGDVVTIIRGRGNNDNVVLVQWRWNATNSQVEWCLVHRDGAGWVTTYIEEPPPVNGLWYCVEVHWINHATAGGSELYINGEMVQSDFTDDTDNFGGLDQIRFGIAYSTDSAITLNMDEIVISDEYIGPNQEDWHVKDGFNLFVNDIDISPTSTGWQVIDTSPYGVPIGASGVILRLVNEGASSYGSTCRKYGSTDSYGAGLTTAVNRHNTVLVGIDKNRCFQMYYGGTDLKVYLKGYTDNAVKFFENTFDISPTANGFANIDLSRRITNRTTGVICLVWNDSSTTTYSGGIRRDGSSVTYMYADYASWEKYGYQMAGIANQSTRLIEGRRSNSDIHIELVGYVEFPIEFRSDGGTDVAPGSGTGYYQDVDITSQTHNRASVGILHWYSSASYDGCTRHLNSVDAHQADCEIPSSSGQVELVRLDFRNVFAFYQENTGIDLYVQGYCRNMFYVDNSATNLKMYAGHEDEAPYDGDDGEYYDMSISAGCTVEGSDEYAYSGKFSLKCTVDNTSESARGLFQHLTSTYFDDEVWIRCRILLPALPTGTEYIRFMSGLDGGWNNHYGVYLDVEGSNFKWRVYNYATSSYYDSAEVPASAYEWISVELYYLIHASAGAIKLWVNGELLINTSGIDTTTAVANIRELHFGKSYDNVVGTIYVDDCCVSIRRIGP